MFMGSSLAPILVERVIEEAVRTCLGQLDFAPDFWVVYVDDQNVLNSYNPQVRFTVETEDHLTKSINFLDTTVYNSDGKLKTCWFCKPIASNRLINFHSAHPSNMIMNTARSFVKRVMSLSHREFYAANLARIKAILKKNSFPDKTINNIIQKSLHSRHNQRPQAETSYPFLHMTVDTSNVNITNNATLPSQPQQKWFGGLTYIPGISDALTKEFNRHLPEVTIAKKPPFQLRSIYTKTKQKVTPLQKAGVVYKIDCDTCTKC